MDGCQTFYGVYDYTLKNGRSFLIKEGLKYKRRIDLNISINEKINEFQVCWIEIINIPNPDIRTGCNYRHPKKSLKWELYRKWKIKCKMKNSNKYVAICDDFNYNLMNYEHDEYLSDFVITIYSN